VVAPIKIRKSEPLLESIDTISVPATTEPFVAKDKFVVNGTTVKIGGFGGNFEDWFLEGDGSVENSIVATTLRCAKLRKSSKDKFLITELGGEAKVETTLTEIWSLLERQPRGENGILSTDSYANTFYVRRGAKGVLRAVRVRWYSNNGWDISAESIEDPKRWSDNRQVFYRIAA
jgi:hypothetical protein